MQTPASHLNGTGCPKCKKNYISNKNEFIDKANKIHNNKYDYSKVVYKNAHTKVCIICPIHGEFTQKPSNHLSNKGCSKCAGNVKFELQEFIDKANKIHNNKYDYSKVVYKNANSPIDIICPVHGIFKQNAGSHLTGGKCPFCTSSKLNYNIFVKRASEKHNNKYDYSKVVYKNAHTKVEIICKKHGSFWQRVCNHLSGIGCPICANEKTAYEKYKNKETILYYVKINDAYKIGVIKRNSKRYSTLEENILVGRYGNKRDSKKDIYVLECIMFNDGYEAYLLEQKIIKNFNKNSYIVKGTDFEKWPGYTELFSCDIREKGLRLI